MGSPKDEERDFPAIMFYVTDFFGHRDVRLMSFGERSLYMHVLMWCHEATDDSVPNDADRLARAAGLTLDEFNKYWPAVRERLTLTDAGALTHPRVRREKEKTKAVSERNRKKANDRWGKAKEEKPAAAKEPSPKPAAKVSSIAPKTDLVSAAKRAAQGDAGQLLQALLDAAASKIIAGPLSHDQALRLAAHDVETLQVLGAFIAAGRHWVQVKDGQEALPIGTVMRANFEGAVTDALAWDKNGRKAQPVKVATGMVKPRTDDVVSGVVDLNNI